MSRRPIPLKKRPVDIALIVFFVINFIFVTYMIDVEQLIIEDPDNFSYPWWPPRWMVDLVHWYGRTFDPVLIARPAWWRATIWIDSLFFGPFYAVAIYAYIKGKDWVRFGSIVWASVMLTNVTIILFEEVNGEHASPELFRVFLANACWLIFPAIVLYRMWRSVNPFTIPVNPMTSHNFKERYGSTALIAGASEGLGFAFAEALAAEGLNLILVARRENVLTSSAAILREKYSVQVTEIVCDLGDTAAFEKVSQITNHFDFDFLVYNAAMSAIGPYLEQDITVHEQIVAVNVMSPLRFIYQAGKKMVAKGKGGIILMSSMAGFQGSGFLTTYASSKAFLRIMAEGLWYEWKDKGVDIITCCAGATATPGFVRTNPGKISFLAPRPQLPDEVVKECMQKLGKLPSFISGHGNKLAAFFMNHLFSRKRAVTVMGDTTRKMYHVRY